MNRTWTIKMKIWALSGFLLLTLLGVSAVHEFNAIRLTDELKELANVQMPAMRAMTMADMMHDGIRANVYAAIVTSESKDQKKFDEILAERDEFAKNIQEHMDTLAKLELPEDTKQAIAPARPKIQAYASTAREIVDLALRGDAKLATAKLPEFDEKFEALEESLGVLGDMIENNAKNAQVEKVRTAENASWVGLMLLGFGLTLGSISAYLFIQQLQKNLRQMIGQLSEESRSVDESAGSLEDTSRRLSDSSTKQASALQETASCVEEITAMVNKTAENSQHLESSAAESNQSALRGKKAVEDMLNAIAEIQASQVDITTQVQKGNEKITEIVNVIGEIGNKTKVINDIVFQTKLLSFNASVEAARAGEHGKGFAVVAEEVGNLAQMSGNAAKEISDMLGSSLHRVNGIVTENRSAVEALIQKGKAKIEVGINVAQACGGALEEIVDQVSEESRLIGEITTAIKEQNQGIHEISKAIQLMDTSTQENSSMSTSAAGLSNSLLTRASALAGMVKEMRILIEGEATNETNASAERIELKRSGKARLNSAA